MKCIETGKFRDEFKLLARTRDAQAAKMTLAPGSVSEDAPENEHPRSEQWLFVVSDRGEALVGKTKKRLKRVALEENSLLVVRKRELHQIRNSGRKPLVTLNFYVPPAYGKGGEPLEK